MLIDQEARLEATNPRRSFIVQAPAGSGKTELLTQRYLRLLSTVRAPEQIIALTFTKKAASEMKERILTALMDAEENKALHSSHQQLTRNYANAALAQSKEQGWQLLKNPERLKIMTIDALCQLLARAIPLYEQQIPYAQVSNFPELHYKKAVQNFLASLFHSPALQPQLSQLLQHLDNRQDKLIELLGFLLGNREQWLPLIYSARERTAAEFEEALAYIETHALQRFIDTTPQPIQDWIIRLSTQVAHIENDVHSPRYALQAWQEFSAISPTIATSLSALLLTKDEKLRKSFDHHVGLSLANCPKALYQSLKAESKELLETLGAIPDFRTALLRVKNIPAPHFEASQWAVLQALLQLLPLLVAHLHLVFAEANEVDFAAIAQQAFLGLGTEEEPTDLALFMDHAIHHLLVDEFQDTSIQQFGLINKLVQEWEPDEGKTLFVVGDPMQSIYRFRQAEVGLFLKAKQQGIAKIALNPLTLCCNFRASADLVDWVNVQFKGIFPAQDDMESGAISFHPSQATRDSSTSNVSVSAITTNTKEEEAKALVTVVKQLLEENPEDNIAILVRSRNQLPAIIAELRNQAISFQGVDIERLSNLPHMTDLGSLTKALLMPADRLPWLALLRSPWVGLGLEDLHAIANFAPKKSIYFALSKLQEISPLSIEGRLRAQYFYQVMHKALSLRNQQALPDWILHVIKELHGDCLLDAVQQADLEQFFVLLARFTKDGSLVDFNAFENEFQKLYSERIHPSRLQIMTIHKSKGLEFDTVILPGLGAKTRAFHKPLLRWLQLPTQAGLQLLMSPIHANAQKKCRLYDYLGEIGLEKEQYEQQRLLYVAVTRAKKRLCLFDSQSKISEGSFRELLERVPFGPDASQSIEEMQEEKPTNLLSRLPLSYYENPPKHLTSQSHNHLPDLLSRSCRTYGIAAHELLQWICDTHPEMGSTLPWGMVENRFKSAGFTLLEQEEALQLLKNQIFRLQNDPIGRWICQKQDSEQNEYELLIMEEEHSVTRILDRTFIEQEVRWIIDFKTGSDEALAEDKHRAQVNAYAKIFVSENRPIRCGLYYLAANRWLHWDFIDIANCL